MVRQHALVVIPRFIQSACNDVLSRRNVTSKERMRERFFLAIRCNICSGSTFYSYACYCTFLRFLQYRLFMRDDSPFSLFSLRKTPRHAATISSTFHLSNFIRAFCREKNVTTLSWSRLDQGCFTNLQII